MTVLGSVAEWMASQDGRWSSVVLERAEQAVADTLACIVAGANDPVSRKVAATRPAGDAGPCTVVDDGAGASAFWAALINGTAAHVLEIDDNFYPALTHASAVLVPALLALAEEHDASGAQTLDAYVVGLEIQAFLGRGVNQSHYFAGWHPTATIGCIGAAAGCARLLGLDGARTIAAMSLAVSMASGNKAQFGAEAKPFQCGMSAANAVLAASLARSGLQAAEDVLENPQGFLALYGGPAPRGWPVALAKLGGPVALEEFGLAPKRHACCGSAHNALDCILDLKKEHGFGADDVERIDVLLGSTNKKNLRYEQPVDEFQARFSLHYNVALILLQGHAGLADFTAEAVQRPEVRRLLGLTVMRGRSFEDEPADADQRLPHVVTITLKDGRRLQKQRVRAKGEIDDPFDDIERSEKIHQCCAPVLPPEQFEALASSLSRLRDLSSMRTLTRALRGAAAH